MEKKTDCECPLAGFCNRHGINKTSHFHKLCQNHSGYFNMWEQCRGPGQNPEECKSGKKENPVSPNVATETIDTPREEVKLPSMFQMAKNFIGSAVTHVGNGARNVTPEKQAERLAICAGCPFFKKDSMRCGHCGCYLETKTKWESSKCPINKW